MRYAALVFWLLILADLCPAFAEPGSLQFPDSGKLFSRELPSAPKDSILQFLLRSTASDFIAQRQSDSIRFQDVHFGHLKSASKEKLYLLCGKFQPAQGEGKDKWIPFVTIKTSGYELYIGANTYCQKSSFIPDNKSDLSTLLQNTLVTMRKKK